MKLNKHWPFEKRNFLSGLLHGTFFKFGSAFSHENSILPAFIYSLTGSPLLVGLLATLRRFGLIAPQLFFASFLESKKYKRPYLVGVLYIRALMWFVMGWSVVFLSTDWPVLTTWIVFVLLTIFFFSGSMGQLVYSYILGSTISPQKRGRFFGVNNLLGGLAGIGAGFLSGDMLKNLKSSGTLTEYGQLFVVTSLAFAVAGIGFVLMREQGDGRHVKNKDLKTFFRESFELARGNRTFRKLLIVALLYPAVLMSVPFFVVLARDKLHATGLELGMFVTMQITGEMLGGLFWGALGDHFGYRKVLIGLTALITITPLFAVLLYVSRPGAFLLVFLLSGFVLKPVDNSVRNYILEISSNHRVPQYVALKNTITAPTLLFPVIGGFILNLFGYLALFYISSILIVGAAITSWLLPEPRNMMSTRVDT